MTLSAEQTKAAQRPKLAAAQRRYAVAAKTLGSCNDRLSKLTMAGAPVPERMEALEVRNKAARDYYTAHRALVNAGWADGTLAAPSAWARPWTNFCARPPRPRRRDGVATRRQPPSAEGNHNQEHMSPPRGRRHTSTSLPRAAKKQS